MDVTYFHGIAARLGDAIATALEGSPAGVPKRLAYPVWGEIALDDCDCGILALSLGRRAQTAQFPIEVSSTALRVNGGTNCVLSEMMDFTVHVARCQPTLESDGDSPTVEAMRTAALIALSDVELVRCTLQVELAAMEKADEIGSWIVNASQPVGPEGACGGYTTSFIIAL